MPEVEELEGSIRAYSKEELDVSFYSCEDFAFVLKTDQNTYEYATRVDDYYIVNGEGRFTPKHWEEYHKNHPKPTPKPKKKSSSGNGKKIIFNGSDDPYEVDMYDDPEDFWEDHEDEFEDFEDAWDYWEENQ